MELSLWIYTLAAAWRKFCYNFVWQQLLELAELMPLVVCGGHRSEQRR